MTGTPGRAASARFACLRTEASVRANFSVHRAIRRFEVVVGNAEQAPVHLAGIDLATRHGFQLNLGTACADK
jgi:hypothetical protein